MIYRTPIRYVLLTCFLLLATNPLRAQESPLELSFSQESGPALDLGGMILSQSGSEVSLLWKLAPTLQFTTATSYTYGLNTETAWPTYFNPRASDWVSGIDLNWEPLPDMNLTAAYQWVGEVVITNAENIWATLEGYSLLNLSLGYTLGDWNIGAAVTLPVGFTNDGDIIAVDDSAFGEFLPHEEVLVTADQALSFHLSLSWSF